MLVRWMPLSTELGSRQRVLGTLSDVNAGIRPPTAGQKLHQKGGSVRAPLARAAQAPATFARAAHLPLSIQGQAPARPQKLQSRRRRGGF